MIIKTTLRLTYMYPDVFIETSVLKDGSQAINAINAINPFDNSGSVSADQLKNEGQQTFQDGTNSVYMHVDQMYDEAVLIKGYTRTITFPSAIFKPADPKNIKQIKVN